MWIKTRNPFDDTLNNQLVNTDNLVSIYDLEYEDDLSQLVGQPADGGLIVLNHYSSDQVPKVMNSISQALENGQTMFEMPMKEV